MSLEGIKIRVAISNIDKTDYRKWLICFVISDEEEIAEEIAGRIASCYIKEFELLLQGLQ